MKFFQPYGAGVNSKALKIIIMNLNNFSVPDYLHDMNIESVFVNPGSEMPGTVEDVQAMNEKGWGITVLKPDVEGFDNIYNYYWHKKLVPMFKYRSCTDKFKQIPQRRYYKAHEPYTLLIGFDYSEKRRVIEESKLKKVFYKYPLVDMKIDRKKCVSIIEEYNEAVPPKSGCYFCIYQSRESWYALMRDYPNLFWKAVALEENCEGMNLVSSGALREMFPPPSTFEQVDMDCRMCMFGISQDR